MIAYKLITQQYKQNDMTNMTWKKQRCQLIFRINQNMLAPFADKIFEVIRRKDDVGLQIEFLETLVQLKICLGKKNHHTRLFKTTTKQVPVSRKEKVKI